MEAPREIQVWSEGWAATGERQPASLLYRGEHASFDEAVAAWMATLPDEGRADVRQEPGGRWSVWGCLIFDNEEDARRAFG